MFYDEFDSVIFSVVFIHNPLKHSVEVNGCGKSHEDWETLSLPETACSAYVFSCLTWVSKEMLLLQAAAEQLRNQVCRLCLSVDFLRCIPSKERKAHLSLH
jgi:hypothetical protein